MNCQFALIFLIIGNTILSMDEPPKPSNPSKASSKSQVIRPTRPVLKGSVITRHQSSKELSQSINQKIGPALMEAVHDGDYERVKELLLIKSTAVNFVSPTQETPLYAALMAPNYHHKILLKFLACHADLTKVVKNKKPVALALEKENLKAALALFYAGAPITEETILDPSFLAKELFYEIKKGRLDRIKKLIKLNAPINIRRKQDQTGNGEEETPLLCTIDVPEKFNRDIFEEIVAIADVNFCAENKLSPLYKAVLCNNEEAACLLVLKDADSQYTMPLYQDQSPNILQLAALMKMTELVKTINSIKLSKSISAEKLKEKINADELFAQLVRQTTPRRTKSPRAEAPKP